MYSAKSEGEGSAGKNKQFLQKKMEPLNMNVGNNDWKYSLVHTMKKNLDGCQRLYLKKCLKYNIQD